MDEIKQRNWAQHKDIQTLREKEIATGKIRIIGGGGATPRKKKRAEHKQRRGCKEKRGGNGPCV